MISFSASFVWGCCEVAVAAASVLVSDLSADEAVVAASDTSEDAAVAADVSDEAAVAGRHESGRGVDELCLYDGIGTTGMVQCRVAWID